MIKLHLDNHLEAYLVPVQLDPLNPCHLLYGISMNYEISINTVNNNISNFAIRSNTTSEVNYIRHKTILLGQAHFGYSSLNQTMSHTKKKSSNLCRYFRKKCYPLKLWKEDTGCLYLNTSLPNSLNSLTLPQFKEKSLHRTLNPTYGTC